MIVAPGLCGMLSWDLWPDPHSRGLIYYDIFVHNFDGTNMGTCWERVIDPDDRFNMYCAPYDLVALALWQCYAAICGTAAS